MPHGEATKTAFINAMNECSETAALLAKTPAPNVELLSKCQDAQQLTNYLIDHYRFPSRTAVDAIATRYPTAAAASADGAADKKHELKTATLPRPIPTIMFDKPVIS